MEETKTFKITVSGAKLMKRLERFLALLHFNSGFGHSGLFAMFLDGDGSDKIKVEGLERKLGYEVNAIGGVGYHVEIANDESYSGNFFDENRDCRWVVGPAAALYKDGDLHKTIPENR